MKNLSNKALKKLELFCTCANKSTGTGHPLDERRWFDFICQTVEDGVTLDADSLADILQDETYCGTGGAWNERYAVKLASEYERACRLLQYYKEA